METKEASRTEPNANNAEATVTLRLHGWFVVLDALEVCTQSQIDMGANPDLAAADTKEAWDAVYAVAGEEWTNDRQITPSAPLRT